MTFDAPRDVAAIDLMPYSDSRGRVEEVTVAGRRFRVHRGWNRLTLGLHRARTLTVVMTKVSEPEDGSGAAGGIRELRIPGVTVREALRPPVLAETALRGRDLSGVGLDYLLERTTADVPLLTSRYVGERGAGLLRDAQDPERQLSRTIDPPVARRYGVDAWATIDPRTADDVLDRLVGGRAGARGAVSATSSSRFDGLARHRASGAFDGGARAWIGQWIPGRPAWLGWTVPEARTVTRLVLTPPAVGVRRPTRVRLTVDGHAEAPVRVGPLGLVTLPRAVRGRHFRLDVLDARFPAGTSGRDRQRRAVGIGEITGAGVPALRAPRRGTVALPAASPRSGSAVASSGSEAPSTVQRWMRAGRCACAGADRRRRSGGRRARDPGRFGRQRDVENAPGFSAKRFRSASGSTAGAPRCDHRCGSAAARRRAAAGLGDARAPPRPAADRPRARQRDAVGRRTPWGADRRRRAVVAGLRREL